MFVRYKRARLYVIYSVTRDIPYLQHIKNNLMLIGNIKYVFCDFGFKKGGTSYVAELVVFFRRSGWPAFACDKFAKSFLHYYSIHCVESQWRKSGMYTTNNKFNSK